MKLHIYLSLSFFLFTSVVKAEQIISINEYINNYKEIAIAEMERTGIPASIKMGQAILESNYGNSALAKNSKNHFGIKCKKEWQGKKYYHKDDDRDKRGRLIKSCFRVYDSVFDSYVDHSNFLMTRERYENLFDYSKTNYKAWAHELKKSGYATAKHYATKLIKIIENNELYILDFKTANPVLAASYASSSQMYQYQLNQKAKEQQVNLQNLSTISTNRLRPLVVTSTDELPNLEEKLYGKSFFPKRYDFNGIFLNNGLRAVLLKDGQTIKDISKTHKISAKKLLKYNDLASEAELIRKQYIYLAYKKKAFDKFDFHKVKKGETLYIIAQLYGVTVKSLEKRNRIENRKLTTGMMIKLNGKKIKQEDASFSVKKVKKKR